MIPAEDYDEVINNLVQDVMVAQNGHLNVGTPDILVQLNIGERQRAFIASFSALALFPCQASLD